VIKILPIIIKYKRYKQMLNMKTIWRDNTMPPTNYIWMRTNMRHELIGVYEWLNGE
jgi:hypothetical protein